jgi:hypothetical protein
MVLLQSFELHSIKFLARSCRVAQSNPDDQAVCAEPNSAFPLSFLCLPVHLVPDLR